jgi:hypothetical protein
MTEALVLSVQTRNAVLYRTNRNTWTFNLDGARRWDVGALADVEVVRVEMETLFKTANDNDWSFVVERHTFT